MNRKDFLTLTLTTLGAAAACGEDDPQPAGSAGSANGGSTNGGKNSGGTHIGASAGKSSAGSGNAGAPSTGAGADQGGAGMGGAGEGQAGEAGAANGGAGESGAGGGGAGDAGAGGEGGGPVGAGGEGGGASGAAGEDGAGGSPEPSACAEGFLTLTGGQLGHDHIPPSAAPFRAALAAHINGGTATMAFTLTEEFGHNHTITLTSNEVQSLLAGNTVSGITSSLSGHVHIYSLNCFQAP